MLNRLVSVIVGLVLIVFIASLVYFSKEDSVILQIEDDKSSSNKSTDMIRTQSAVLKILLTEIAQHNSRSSCWSAINGNVYDLTSWIPNHPGGEENILRLCGKDGSDDYNDQHGKESKPATILVGFKLGVLVK